MIRKSVLITGCSEGGIGDALAQTFHRRGLQVFATVRNPAKAEHLRKLGMTVVQLDVIDPESLKAAVETVSDMTDGRLDFLVNNSGGGYNAPLLDADLDEAKRLFDVNVFGVIGTTQAFFPLLQESKGTIINIGSIAGVAPFPWQGFYNASKAAVNLLSDNLRIELEPFGVKVICVVTGGVKTNFYDNSVANPLPDDSAYDAGREIIEGTSKFARSMGVDVYKYAERVVDNALKESPNVRPWYGGAATRVWLATTFLWHTFADLSLPSKYGVDEFKKRYNQEKDKQ